MKRTASISDILRPLKDAPNQAYLSNAVQVADILEWVLSQVGVAEIWQTSFSISEEFLRRLYFICKEKKVSSISLVLDHKATNKTLKLWAFINQVIERTYLADNHSKILLVRAISGNRDTGIRDSDKPDFQFPIPNSNAVQTVSVVTSQNLTRGNRAESAFISTDPGIFAALFSQVNDLITNHSVPLNDLFNQRINAD